LKVKSVKVRDTREESFVGLTEERERERLKVIDTTIEELIEGSGVKRSFSNHRLLEKIGFTMKRNRLRVMRVFYI
jgi:hypothetical protein